MAFLQRFPWISIECIMRWLATNFYFMVFSVVKTSVIGLNFGNSCVRYAKRLISMVFPFQGLYDSEWLNSLWISFKNLLLNWKAIDSIWRFNNTVTSSIFTDGECVTSKLFSSSSPFNVITIESKMTFHYLLKTFKVPKNGTNNNSTIAYINLFSYLRFKDLNFHFKFQ